MTPIILNEENLSYMRNTVRSASIPHAIIIEGAEGSGKYTLARHFAALINCQSSQDAPCGVCESCIKIFKEVHADVTCVDLADDKKSISVFQVRQVISEAALIPSEANKRIFIIRNGQALTVQAQNAFLKIFEEPPKDVIFIMLTTDKRLLLPTVVSRAVTLKTQLLPDDVIASQLCARTKKGEAETQAAVSVAQGSLGKALELLSGTKILRLRETVEKYFSLLSKPASVYALCAALAPQSFKRDELLMIFPFFRLAFRDIAMCKCGEIPPVFFTDKEIMKKAAANVSAENIITLYEKTDKLCNALLSNINPYTAVTAFNAYTAEYFRLGQAGEK